MLLLIIFIAVAVICVLIFRYGPWDIDTDWPEMTLGIIFLLSVVSAFVCLCMLIGAKVPTCERAERIKREEPSLTGLVQHYILQRLLSKQ